MSEFGRRLDHINALGDLAKKSEAHWWKDLLSLWRPSGIPIPAGDYGLRLAIRNGYLNFYRRGQSIARVEIDSKGTPTAHTHIKYVRNSTGEPLGQKYLKLRDGWLLRNGDKFQPYEGLATLKAWISVVDGGPDRRGYSGVEKKFVDRLVAANPNVIDLEMGLPAWGDQETAPRMDLVAIEPSADGLNVVFWEAKLVTDGRVRSRADVETDMKPEVLKQLADYRKFLKAKGHVELVAKAYREAAKVIVELRTMADGVAPVHPLGANILAASKSDLCVDPEPRLVLLNQKDANQTAWAGHARKLKEAGVVMTVIEEGGSFLLSPPV